MQMIVRTVKGKRLWSFTVDEKQLYDMVCTQIAWRVVKKSGIDVKKVEKQTVQLAVHSHKRPEEEIKTIVDFFVRAVIQERKRLNLDDYQITTDGEEEEDGK